MMHSLGCSSPLHPPSFYLVPLALLLSKPFSSVSLVHSSNPLLSFPQYSPCNSHVPPLPPLKSDTDPLAHYWSSLLCDLSYSRRGKKPQHNNPPPFYRASCFSKTITASYFVLASLKAICQLFPLFLPPLLVNLQTSYLLV